MSAPVDRKVSTSCAGVVSEETTRRGGGNTGLLRNSFESVVLSVGVEDREEGALGCDERNKEKTECIWLASSLDNDWS